MHAHTIDTIEPEVYTRGRSHGDFGEYRYLHAGEWPICYKDVQHCSLLQAGVIMLLRITALMPL